MREFTAILVALAIGIWSYFAFSLGPSLWRTNRPAFYWWMVAAVIYGWLIVQVLYSGWLGRAENSTGVQTVAAAAQAVFAVALIVLTVRTVQANAKLVEETEKMAEVAVQQQQAAIRPCVAFRIHPASDDRTKRDVEQFQIEAFNVGAGPALDTRITVRSPFRYSESSELVHPLAIAPQEAAIFAFKLDDETPFLDAAEPMRWPRTDEDAKLINEREAGEWAGLHNSKNKSEYDRHAAVRTEVWTRQIRYYKDLTARVARFSDIGQVRAEYRDLAGSIQASSAELRLIEQVMSDVVADDQDDETDPPSFFRPDWPIITLGPLKLSTPAIPIGHEAGVPEAAP